MSSLDKVISVGRFKDMAISREDTNKLRKANFKDLSGRN
jgi:hypothetical protein